MESFMGCWKFNFLSIQSLIIKKKYYYIELFNTYGVPLTFKQVNDKYRDRTSVTSPHSSTERKVFDLKTPKKNERKKKDEYSRSYCEWTILVNNGA